MGLKDAIRRAKEGRDIKPELLPESEVVEEIIEEDSSYGNFNESAIQKIIDNIDEIPTLPSIATLIMDKINNPMSDAKQIAEIIKNDQSLTAKILKMSNSVYFKGYSDITSIQTAIARLGIMNIRRMVLTVSVFDAFESLENYSFTLKDFWHHSIAVATCARLIGERIGVQELEDLFTSGILHDIGKLIMVNHVEIMFGEVMDFIETNETYSFYEAEKKLFNFSHCDIGSWLAVKWNMSRKIQNVIFRHHKPIIDTSTFTRDVLLFPCIINIADNLVKKHEIGFSGDKNYELDEEILNFVLGKHIELEPIEEKFLGEKEKMESLVEGMK